jgi:hypothetical protein
MIMDGDANRILSATMVAGTKNSRNEFTGVVLGEVTKNDTTDSPQEIHSGILGFKEGAASFGFNTNGTAFIGNPNSGGMISFNGERGIIES